MPIRITYTDGRKIEFIYDATGKKWRKTALNANGTTNNYRDYIGDAEYQNGQQDIIHFTEGYAQRDITTDGDGVWNGWVYKYTLKDHLGNTRVTYSDRDKNGLVTTADIEQVNHYYPFGMNMEGPWNGADGAFKNQYNGKEWNDDFGLGWNHHDWRFLDVAIDRFVTIDRKSEEDDQKQLSPYHFSANNPIRYNDPDGQCPTCLTGFLIGFALDVATQVVFEGKSLSDVSYSKAAVSGVAGALSGGISSVVKMGRIASIGVNAGIDATESVAKQAIDGKISGEQVLSDVVMGGIGNEAKVIKQSDIKVKENTLDRANRVAAGDPKSSGRAQNVDKAEKSLDKAKSVNAAGEIQTGNTLQSTSDKTRSSLKATNSSSPLIKLPVQVAQDNTRVVKPPIN